MRVVLATQHADAAFAPLALLYLKASLHHQLALGDADVAILEFAAGTAAAEIAERILDCEPDIVGLSCYVWNVRSLLAACGPIRHRRPATRIVIGGPEVGPLAATVLAEHPTVDAVVRGEGEMPIVEIVSRWQRGADISDVAGVTYRREVAGATAAPASAGTANASGGARAKDAQGDAGAAEAPGGCDDHASAGERLAIGSRREIVENPDAPIVRQLDDLPSPHLTLSIDLTGRVVCIETQRGCVFRCNFCFYNKDLSIRNRRFGLDRIKEEIAYWLRQEVAELYLMDPIFNLNAERAKEICRFIAANNTRRIGIHAEVWAEFIDDELAQLMRAAGFTFLEIGLQSTDPGALATVERRLRLQQFLAGVTAVQTHGLAWELQLIMGLPGETRESFRRSLDFAASLDAPVLAVYPLMVLPGTELWRNAAALLLQFDPDPPYHVRSHQSMSADDIAYGFRVVRALQEIGDSRALRALAREQGIGYSDVVDAWMAWDDEQGGSATIGYRIKHFLIDYCARRRVPADWSRTLAAMHAG